MTRTHASKILRERARSRGGSIRSYALGFTLSLLLTLVSFILVPSVGTVALPLLILSALLQLFVQLTFFLHLGRGGTTGSYTVLLWFSAVIIGIVVIGTLWIMTNLERLHPQSPTTRDLYEHGMVAPQNELR